MNSARTRALGGEPATQMHYARKGLVTEQMRFIGNNEKVAPDLIRADVALVRLVIPANIHHEALDPMGIGLTLSCKINANIGNSAVSSEVDGELRKLDTAVKLGADTVMDLSTGGAIDEIREAIIAASTVPIGTVPIYQVMAELDSIGEKKAEARIDMVEHQAKQGVDYMTLHAGV